MKKKEKAKKGHIFRKRLIILPKIQGPLIALSVVSCGLGIGLTHLAYHIQYPPLGQLEKSLSFVLSVSGLLGFITFAVLIYFSILVSNLIVGPMYRLRNHMSDVAKGRPPEKFILRSHDFHPELIESYNELLDFISKK